MYNEKLQGLMLSFEMIHAPHYMLYESQTRPSISFDFINNPYITLISGLWGSPFDTNMH